MDNKIWSINKISRKQKNVSSLEKDKPMQISFIKQNQRYFQNVILHQWFPDGL